MNKWNRSLGTSKMAQGVITPAQPYHPKRRLEALSGKPAAGVKSKHGILWTTEDKIKTALNKLTQELKNG